MNNTSRLNMNTSSSKFDLPDSAKCSLLTCWNKTWRGKMPRSKSFGLLCLWAGPREKSGMGPLKKPGFKCKTSLMGSKERSRGLKLQRWNLLQNKNRPFSISWCLVAPAHVQHHAHPAMLPLPSGCSCCSGTSFGHVLTTRLKPRHKSWSCLHTSMQQPL